MPASNCRSVDHLFPSFNRRFAFKKLIARHA
jgi:hypothetical protein